MVHETYITDLRAYDLMPHVKVRYFASLRELLGNTKEEEYEFDDGTTLMDLLLVRIPERHRNASKSWKERIFATERGEIKFEKNGTPILRGYYLILVNGRAYSSISEDERHPGLRYKLKDGDKIVVLPPVGGG